MNNETIMKIYAVIWSKDKSRMPDTKSKEQSEMFRVVKSMWVESFRDISDKTAMDAAAKWMRETSKVYPSDDPMAAIYQLAKPQLVETEGDCLELADEAVCRFGYMRAESALEWIREKPFNCGMCAPNRIQRVLHERKP